jgi:hypothetical protein
MNEVELLASLGITEESAKKAAVETAGPMAAAASGAVGGIPIVGPFMAEKGLEIATGQPGMREQLRADYPVPTMMGEAATSFIGGGLAGRAGKAAAGKVAPAAGAMIAEMLYGAAEGGTQGGAEGALLGGALGAVPGAADVIAGKRVAKATKEATELAAKAAAAEKANAPIMKQISKLQDDLRKADFNTRELQAGLESESIGRRQAAAKQLDSLEQGLIKERKALADIQGKIDRSAEATMEGTPEFAEVQKAQQQLNEASKALAMKEKALDSLLVRAEVAGGVGQARAVEQAQRGVRKAEEGVFNVEEEAASLDMLRQMIEKIGKRRAGPGAGAAAPIPTTGAAAPELPAPIAQQPTVKTIEDMKKLERELIENAWAEEPGIAQRALGRKTGINKDTLARRLAEYGITKESAQQAVAARKAAAQVPTPETAPSVFEGAPPTGKGKKKKGIFDEYPVQAQDIRTQLRGEATLPAKSEAQYERLRRAQQELEQVQAPRAGIEEGPMGSAIALARSMRDEAAKAVEAANAQLAEAQTLLNFAPTPQARSLYSNELAAAQEAVQAAEQRLAKAQSDFASAESAESLKAAPKVRAAESITASLQEEIKRLEATLQAVPNISEPAKKTLMQKLRSPGTAEQTASLLSRLFRTSTLSEIYDQDVEPLL